MVTQTGGIRGNRGVTAETGVRMCVLQSSNVKELLLQLQIKIHGVARSVQLYCWTRSGTEERTTASFLGHPIITDEELKMCEHVAKKQSSTDRGGASKGNSQQRTCRHDGSVTLNVHISRRAAVGLLGTIHHRGRTMEWTGPLPRSHHLHCFIFHASLRNVSKSQQ